ATQKTKMSALLPRENLNLNCSDQNRMSCQVRRRGTVEGKASLRDWRICSRRQADVLRGRRRGGSAGPRRGVTTGIRQVGDREYGTIVMKRRNGCDQPPRLTEG